MRLLPVKAKLVAIGFLLGFWLLLVAALALAEKASGANGQRAEPSRAVVLERVRRASNTIAFFERIEWVLAPRKARCSEVPWKRSCLTARKLVFQRFQQRERDQRWLYTHLPKTNDWVTAVKIAQRPYPGTAGWLLGCSAAESSHGRPVWHRASGRYWDPKVGHVGYDSTGDVVFGNMQIRFTTFRPVWPQMLRDLKRRGFHPPELGWIRTRVVVGASTGYGPWISPLGQALVAGYMRYYGKDGHHWSASHGKGC